jgi:hypothetical protein
MQQGNDRNVPDLDSWMSCVSEPNMIDGPIMPSHHNSQDISSNKQEMTGNDRNMAQLMACNA